MIKYQRIFMFAFGYFVVAAAYSLKFLPDTVLGFSLLSKNFSVMFISVNYHRQNPYSVISIVFIITGGLGTCSAFSFVCGMMSKRTNRKGFYLISVQKSKLIFQEY